MPRPKSILQRVEVDEAKKAHNCQHNAAHRVMSGDKRLKVSDGRSNEHYCATCAIAIINRDIAKLQEMAERLQR